ncbi:hypothetical protein ABTX81_17440 [Kitasatospora sp. NPDC097605]|uniref:hypothetical protein n=1 Tax=Kitasatospora sp. NPDC097605 TaxID=3157226 RepID=UPI0033310BE3
MSDAVVGRASAIVRGDQALWRVSDLTAASVSDVVGLLGGTPREGSAGWDVVTVSAELRAQVIAADDNGLRFRLVGAPGLGLLELRLAPWGVAGVLGERAAGLLLVLPVAVHISLRVTEFTTLAGRMVRLAAPSLGLCV